jgi:putative membrane protein
LRNIWRIFKDDITYGVSNIISIIMLMGLALIPALYAWYNIAGSWDPYGNTGGLKVAVANNDAGYRSDLVTVPVNLGDSVVSTLHSNDSFDWVFVDESEAVDGVHSGRYYASIVIPEDFSAKMMTIVSPDETQQATIIYYTNEKENPIAPRITEKGASSVQEGVSSQFTQTVDEVVLGLASDIADYAQSDKVNDYIALMGNRLDAASGDLREVSARVRALSDLMASVAKLSEASVSALGGTSVQGRALADAATDARGEFDSAFSAFGSVSSSISSVLEQAETGFDELSQKADAAFALVEQQEGAASDQLRTLSGQVSDLAAAYQHLRDIVAAIPGAETLVKSLDRSIANLQDLAGNLEQAASDADAGMGEAEQMRADVKDLIADARSSLEDVRSDYENELKGRIESLGGTLDEIAAASGSISDSVDTTLADLASAAGSLTDQVNAQRDSFARVADRLDAAANEIDQMHGDLRDALTSHDLDRIRQIIGSDPSSLAAYLVSPVKLDRQAIYPVANYGSSMAPYYTLLSFWVGSLILVAMTKVQIPRERLEELGEVRLYQQYLGRYLIYALLGLAQSTLICLGDLFFLDIQCLHPMLFLVTGWVVCLVFNFIIYTLSVSFGDVGKAIGVILLVMQVAGSGGTFPIEMFGRFFQVIYPFLPFTPGMHAFQACIAGINGSEWAVSIGQVLLWVLPALLLGLVLRRPIIRMNVWFEEKLEETKLM